MERDLKVLIVGARYLVDKVFCTFTYNISTNLYGFLPAPFDQRILKCRFLSVGETERLKNPIFDLKEIPFKIEDYTLETGDYCKDFPKYAAAKILKAGTPLVQLQNIDAAFENNLIFLFAGKTLGWKLDFGTLGKEYSWMEFYERYTNLLLIDKADYFL